LCDIVGKKIDSLSLLIKGPQEIKFGITLCGNRSTEIADFFYQLLKKCAMAQYKS